MTINTKEYIVFIALVVIVFTFGFLFGSNHNIQIPKEAINSFTCFYKNNSDMINADLKYCIDNNDNQDTLLFCQGTITCEKR